MDTSGRSGADAPGRKREGNAPPELAFPTSTTGKAIDMSHPYKTREGGATVTIFVPYDCKNHCPFCINKEEYADMTGFSLEKILESIRRMDAITPA